VLVWLSGAIGRSAARSCPKAEVCSVRFADAAAPLDHVPLARGPAGLLLFLRLVFTLLTMGLMRDYLSLDVPV
jgi:hypothetical protein